MILINTVRYQSYSTGTGTGTSSLLQGYGYLFYGTQKKKSINHAECSLASSSKQAVLSYCRFYL